MKARWNFSYSPSERKTISGTTFYKVAIGSETRWLSMSGIKMLHNAREAGTAQKAALKGASYYTGQGTRVRVGKMRRRIAAELGDLMQLNPEDFEGLRKGLVTMTNLGSNEGLYNRMKEMLSIMTEDELRTFYMENRMLLERFFTDSDKTKGTPATGSEAEDKATEKNINRNARRLLDRMMEIVARRV